MADDNTKADKPYKILAEIIYAEHPEFKEQLNKGAALAIEGLRSALTIDLPAKDLETVLSMVAAIMADLLATSVNGISDKINLIFDTYSLGAGAVMGEIDLGDTSEAKDLITLVKEAQERALSRTQTDEGDQTGLYL